MKLKPSPVSVTRTAAGVKVSINGTAHNNIEALERELDQVLADKPKHVELDLAATEYVSTIEIGALISFRSRILSYGGTVQVVAIQPQVLGIFQCTHLAKIFGINPTTTVGGAT